LICSDGNRGLMGLGFDETLTVVFYAGGEIIHFYDSKRNTIHSDIYVYILILKITQDIPRNPFLRILLPMAPPPILLLRRRRRHVHRILHRRRRDRCRQSGLHGSSHFAGRELRGRRVGTVGAERAGGSGEQGG